MTTLLAAYNFKCSAEKTFTSNGSTGGSSCMPVEQSQIDTGNKFEKSNPVESTSIVQILSFLCISSRKLRFRTIICFDSGST